MKARQLSVGFLTSGWPGVVLGLGLVGLLVLLVGIVAEPTLAWTALLVAGLYGISITMGAALFVAANGAPQARWWLAVRRGPLLLMDMLPAPAAAILLAVMAGASQLYPWANHTPHGEHDLIAMKAGWLNTPFFLGRCVIILVVWFGLLALLKGGIRRLDSEPEAGGGTLQRRSVLFLIGYAITVSVASWDWTMSLEPEWFSTMYGVYNFAGSFQAGIAAVAVIYIMFLNRNRTKPEVLHDLGRLLFGFSGFWAYIWYCQYMLIWYSNLPEEITFFATRLSGGWTMIFWLSPLLNFVIPFLALLSARAKRNPAVLLQVSIVVLIGRWFDILLLVAPATSPNATFPGFAIAATAVVVAGMVLLLLRAGARMELQPRNAG